MEIKLTKESNVVKLFIDKSESIDLERIDSKLLEDFLESCLDGTANLIIEDSLEEHPLTKLFKNLYETKDPNNDFNIKVKGIKEEYRKISTEVESIQNEIEEDELPF